MPKTWLTKGKHRTKALRTWQSSTAANEKQPKMDKHPAQQEQHNQQWQDMTSANEKKNQAKKEQIIVLNYPGLRLKKSCKPGAALSNHHLWLNKRSHDASAAIPDVSVPTNTGMSPATKGAWRNKFASFTSICFLLHHKPLPKVLGTCWRSWAWGSEEIKLIWSRYSDI